MLGKCLKKKRKQSDEEPISLVVGKSSFVYKTFQDKQILTLTCGNLNNFVNFVFSKVYVIKSFYELCLQNPLLQFRPQLKEEEDFTEFYRMDKQYVLVLDLDETLIHSDIRKTSPLDKEIEVPIGDSVEKYYVKKRPYLEHFLNKMSQIFEIVIYTASQQQYADQVIDYIDPQKLISRRFYRQDCIRQNRSFYKNLNLINDCLEKVFIIDNSQSGFILNQDNGLLIRSWYCDQYDKELLEYSNFLSNNFVNAKEDVREIIKQLKTRFKDNILNS